MGQEEILMGQQELQLMLMREGNVQATHLTVKHLAETRNVTGGGVTGGKSRWGSYSGDHECLCSFIQFHPTTAGWTV